MTKQKLVEIAFNVGDVVRLTKLVRDGNVQPTGQDELNDLAIVTEQRAGGYALYFRNQGYRAWFKPEQLKLVKKFEWPEA